MKFLHTADWHVGKTLKGRDRLDEQRAVLGEIASIAEANQVDAVLVAGDVYDLSAPSAPGRRRWGPLKIRRRPHESADADASFRYAGPLSRLVY